MRGFARSLFLSMSLLGSIVAFATVAVPTTAADPLPTGEFAVGDLSAALDAPVTFWGAKWWTANQVSTGAAPAAFKGYAVNVDPTACTFTTAPGNSAPPPSGPLPSVITVAVTDSVAKSGSTISGTITEFALVQTDDGYESDPGHPGTGTLIGLIPCIAGF